MNQVSTPAMTVGTTRAADGVPLGYRQAGHGPGLLILHGAMSSGWNHAELAQRLADDFTVFLPDRRGRGLSPRRAQRDGIATDVADLRALLAATGARFVLGVSSGAIIALHATAAASRAGEAPPIDRLAIFEPPLFTDPAHPAALLDQFDRAMARGRLAAAAVIGMQGAELGPPLLNRLPVWMVSPMVRLGMRIETRQLAKHQTQHSAGAPDVAPHSAGAPDVALHSAGPAGRAPGQYVPMTDLIPLLHDDFDIVQEASGRLDELRDVPVPVLLMGGSDSPAYLRDRLADLELRIPDATRVTFGGAGHDVTWNQDRGGNPAVVAPELTRWLT